MLKPLPSLLLSLSAVLLCQQAQALTFQTRLERIEWQVEGDQFECRLSQPIHQFGTGEFVRRAGEQATFRLRSQERWFAPGGATLLAAAAPWQAQRGDLNLGTLQAGVGDVPVTSSQEQAGRLLAGLLRGRSPLVRHRTLHGAQPLEVRLLPARFAEAYARYQACTAKLLPVNFDQLRNTQVGFPGGGIELDDRARGVLDVILDYMQADPSVLRIELDGHSDNSGNRLLNRDLSRRRAMAVFDYFKSKGIAEERMTLRFHGERYPLVRNDSAGNRAKNRRVTVTLSREPLLSAEAP